MSDSIRRWIRFGYELGLGEAEEHGHETAETDERIPRTLLACEFTPTAVDSKACPLCHGMQSSSHGYYERGPDRGHEEGCELRALLDRYARELEERYDEEARRKMNARRRRREAEEREAAAEKAWKSGESLTRGRPASEWRRQE